MAPDRFTILVMGGSQGSQAINKAFLDCLSRAPAQAMIQVIHLSGDKDNDLLQEGYRRLSIPYALMPFSNAMHYAYSAADLALCRCGALTITELIAFRLPSILIPYPHARGHQEHNAHMLTECGCAVVLDESRLSAAALWEQIALLLDTRARLEEMRAAFTRFSAECADKALVEACIDLENGND